MDIKKLIGPLAALVMMMGATTAKAEGLSYDYLEFGYSSVDISGIDGDGFGIGASFGMSESVFAQLSYSSLESEDLDIGFGPGTITISGFTLGVGWHTAMSERTDFIVGLGYITGELESSIPGASGTLDNDATTLSVGFRGLATDNLELSGGLMYLSGDGSSDTTWQVGGLYNFGKMGVGVSYSDDEDVEQMVVGLRLNF